jgi:hypothetical protein
MALRLLAGPFPMKDIDGNYARFFKKPTWFDSLMAMPAVVTITKPTGDSIQPGMLVQLDGTVCARNNALSYYDVFCHDMAGTGIAVVNSYAFGLATRGVNPVSLIAEGDAVANPLQLNNGAYFLADRTLILSGTTIYGRAYGGSGNGTAEAVITSGGLPTGGLGNDYSPGPEQGQVFISGVGAAVLYDYNAHEIIGWRRTLATPAKHSLMYSASLGVWLAVHEVNTPSTHHTITIYADEPVPSTLSAPVALGTVGEGSAVEYRTRLLGASGEPCAGVLVDWSSTTPGVVQIAQSTTDADGYALTRVALPPGTEGADFDLTAEVLE